MVPGSLFSEGLMETFGLPKGENARYATVHMRSHREVVVSESIWEPPLSPAARERLACWRLRSHHSSPPTIQPGQ